VGCAVFLAGCAAFFYALIANNKIIENVQLRSDDRGLLLVWWWILTFCAIILALSSASKLMRDMMLQSARDVATNLSGSVSSHIARTRALENEIRTICTQLEIPPSSNFRNRIQDWIEAHKSTLIGDIRALDGEITQATADAQGLHDHLKHSLRIYASIERDHVETSYTIARHQGHSLMPVLDDCHKRMLAVRGEFLPRQRWREFVSELEKISEELAEIRSLAPDAPQVSQASSTSDDDEWEEPRTKQEQIAKARKILAVTENASAEDIETRFKGLSRAFHPDHFQSDSIDDEMYKESEERYKRVTWAYHVLTRNGEPARND
ncbi:MAG: DnaJ domain-containing protein, partial [Verrucomicrobiota bacterium]